jgi:hypothetical protein
MQIQQSFVVPHCIEAKRNNFISRIQPRDPVVWEIIEMVWELRGIVVVAKELKTKKWTKYFSQDLN